MDWEPLARVLLRGVIAYAAILAYIRLSGNRTLAKLRAFDFVVTIALGTMLASTIVDRSLPLLHGLAALALLILLQYVVARLSTHSRLLRNLVTNDAVLLYRDGKWQEDAMRRARVTRDEVEGAMRQAGHGSPDTADAAWLEVNGAISVVPLGTRAGARSAP
ncbi:MAG TPA: YetF domain-containing protein [Candidatus Thermoplasmatota archaeon]|nr:YetF domain-containing protein [Candidatus Thermoplasmatota archaeon]